MQDIAPLSFNPQKTGSSPVAQQVRSKRKKKPGLKFVSTCGAGFEDLVAEEIKDHGGTGTLTRPGAVSWEGNIGTAYRLCLWSRFTSRILLQIAEFEAPDTDALYSRAGKIDWDEHFDPRHTFAVHCTLTDSPITHSRYAALRIKDAIVDQFRTRTGRRPDVDVMQPGMRINLHIHGDLATLAVDLSGDSLHRRGYRVAGVEAPMKENLAAAIVHLSGWTPEFPPDSVLLDPMCGSGTLLIEAAMIYGDSAPGLQRKSFGFMYWRRHDARTWEKLVTEAVRREEEGLQKKWPRIIGFDADPQAVSAARKNIVEAGLEEKIEVSQRQIAHLERVHDSGMLLVNPPYGERLSDREEIKYLYRCLGRKFSREMGGWQIGFFAANPDLTGTLGMEWSATHRLFNGPIKCRLHYGTAVRKKEKPKFFPTLGTRPAGEDGQDFANRLAKNCASLFPWARKENISCFRLYDADLPEYNIAVDLYEEWIHVQEYAPPKTVDTAKSALRFKLALQIIRDLLGIPHSRLFIKTRRQQKGKNQYQKKSTRGRLFEVREQECRFLVNFTDYLDTGLFLDHRRTRLLIGSLARGRKFLNLFGYTGSATIHAMMGGAIATTTVDSSAAYLQRARANMALNGFGGPQHTTIQKDCFQWLGQCRERYGLIFVDPPTFSNSRHRKTSFNIQDDHEKLLRLAMQRLSRSGQLLFSTNFRQFHLAESLMRDFTLREITRQTMPEDFRKKPPIHRCWEIRHPDGDES
jgi:23S rRNA (guanine2445-N2)-methyltransferase / 23S rRNA (guanine2069-N7)-methyltransferase